MRASRRDEAEGHRRAGRARKGGPEFFSSQIIIQEEQSGSGTFDLRRTHGLSSAKSYRNVTAWACEAGDYRSSISWASACARSRTSTIAVSREKDIVNVISLHALDPDLKKHIQVKMMDSGEILCRDLGEGCIDRIYYDRE